MWKDRGFRIFSLIWFGQVISLLGTAMTRFALLIWAYEQTGKATTLALLGFFAFIMYVLISPIAGVWVDRLDRRKVMIVGDLGAGTITLTLMLLFATDHLQIWHLYAAELLTGVFESFQMPAYNASISLFVPREHLARANGMRSLGFYSTRIIAPAAAGLLLKWVGLPAVFIFDAITFVFAVGSLLIVQIPRPVASSDGAEAQGSFWKEMQFGIRYIWQRRGLFWLMMVLVGINFFGALTYLAVMAPMILSRTGGDELALSAVQTALGVGGVLGGVIITFWGGPKRKIHGVLGMCGISFLFGDFLFAIGQSTPVWVFAALVAAFFIPFLSSSERSIWQAKVPPDIQGRVFSTAQTLQELPLALGYLVAGPLADRILEPAMLPGGALAPIFGGLVGTGAGAGMGVMFLFTATCGALVSFGGYLIPSLRDVEIDLPDYEEAPTVEVVPAAIGANAVAAVGD